MNVKLSSLIMIVASLLCSTKAATVGAPENTATDLNRRMGRGLNILSDDPAWKDPAAARIQEGHFKLIREAGFSNVRIAVHPFAAVTNQTDFTIAPKFFTTLDWALGAARKHGLIAIVDFHEHHAMGRDPLSKKRAFLAMWRQIAEHCKAYPNDVLFEICNEPNMKPDIWNELQEEARQIIRASNPNRTLIIGAINGNQIQYLPDLRIPAEERNVIVAIHYYMPIQFTHQGAPWSKKNKDLKDIRWTATEPERAAIVADFDLAQKWARENSRPLTLGEFGAYEKAAMPHRQLWTNFVAREAEKRDWSWSYWQFDSDFIAYDINRGSWVEPILNSLVPGTHGTQ